jgi:hypothetical protein
MAAHPGFTLSQMIKNVAQELRDLKPDVGAKPVIKFEGCEIELAVIVGAEAGGGFKFWVIDAETKATAETSSKVTLKFGPVGALQATDGAIVAAVTDRHARGPISRRQKGAKARAH